MMILRQQTVNLVSWTLGLLDQLFRVLNLVLGPARPKFFAKGRGDLASYYDQQTALLDDVVRAKWDKYTLSNEDITWTLLTSQQSNDATVKVQQGCFQSPLAEVLPEESKMAQFVLVEPSSSCSSSSSAKPDETDNVFVIMLPATGEMGKGTRLSMARTLAKEYGWSSIILTAAYYGKRRPSGQQLFFLSTVNDLMLQALSIFTEGAMLANFFQNQYGKIDKHQSVTRSKVCVTGFSFGAAMAANTCALATRLGVDGKRLACALYVGSASPVVLADGVLQSSIDYNALRIISDGSNKNQREEESLATAQKWLYDEFNQAQLTQLTTDVKTGKQVIMDNPIAVVRGTAMKHDAFIPPRYALELQKQLLTATSPNKPPIWQWCWGGHVWAALLRPMYHKALVVDTVKELLLDCNY